MDATRFGDSQRVPQMRDPQAGSIAVGADRVRAWHRTQVMAGLWQGPRPAKAIAERFELPLDVVGGVLAEFEMIGMAIRESGGRWTLSPDVVPAVAVDIHDGNAAIAVVSMATRMGVSELITAPADETLLDRVADFARSHGIMTIGVSADSLSAADWVLGEDLTLGLLNNGLGAVLVDHAVAALSGQELILPSPFVGTLSLSRRDGVLAAAMSRPGTFSKVRLPMTHWVTTPGDGPQCRICGRQGCVSAWVAEGSAREQAVALVEAVGAMACNLHRTLFTGFTTDVVDVFRNTLYERGSCEGSHLVACGYATHPYLQGAAIFAGTHNLVSLDLGLHLEGLASQAD